MLPVHHLIAKKEPVVLCNIAFALFFFFLISCRLCAWACACVRFLIKLSCYLIDGGWFSFLFSASSLARSPSADRCAQQAIWDAMCIDYTHISKWYRGAKDLSEMLKLATERNEGEHELMRAIAVYTVVWYEAASRCHTLLQRIWNK